MTTDPSDTAEDPPASPTTALTGQILDRFADRLRESAVLDSETIDALLNLARRSSKPKSAEIAALFEPKGNLE